jgi:hypothetical protein
MNTKLGAAAISLLLATTASPHRLDEYLQATILSVEKDRVHAFLRLIPGVAVSSSIMTSIDTNGDGVLSATEQRTYAKRVLRDLLLSIDGHSLKPRLVSADFPGTAEMKEGLGEIQIEFSADVPRSNDANRKLIFENYHQSRIAAYLVNCLVPRDRNIRITAQNRNENQSFYQLNYVQGSGHSDTLSLQWWLGICEWLGTVAFLLSATLMILRQQRARTGKHALLQR